MKKSVKCQKCGHEVLLYKNPFPTVDIIIHRDYSELVLIKRKNPPYGWALPGGFVDYGETVEEAAIREAREETSLTITLESLFGVYSDPLRDPRQHNISVVFVATSSDFSKLEASDDALEIALFPINSVPELVFDHSKIVSDFLKLLNPENHNFHFVQKGNSICKSLLYRR